MKRMAKSPIGLKGFIKFSLDRSQKYLSHANYLSIAHISLCLCIVNVLH